MSYAMLHILAHRCSSALPWILSCLLYGTVGLADAALARPSPDDILRQVDAYRMPLRSFEAAIRITPMTNGQAQESGAYIIRSAGRNQVLVEATSFEQFGQKFLTAENGLFFYAPRTRRAIRLTPLQTLRGLASIGDISRINFAGDYDATETADTAFPPQLCPDRDCLALELKSRHNEATYARIVLIVARQHGLHDRWRPQAAMLYVASGKLLKIARFDVSRGGLPPATHYTDPQDTTIETVVAFDNIAPAAFPANLFNPRALEQ